MSDRSTIVAPGATHGSQPCAHSFCCFATCYFATIALACLSLCSCRSLGLQTFNEPTEPIAEQAITADTPPAEPTEVVQMARRRKPRCQQTSTCSDAASIPIGAVPLGPAMDQGVPLPDTIVTQWAPPGISLPWPHDEYLHDGGDRGAQVTVSPDHEIRGLELEDTVVHFDTIDGRRVVEPSNRVHLYSPRFGAVRQVTGVRENEQRAGLSQIDLKQRALQQDERRLAATATQPLQPEGEIAIKQPSVRQLNLGEGNLLTRLQLARTDGALQPHEDLRVLRDGVFDQAQRPQLIESIDAAIVWTHDKAVQVILDDQEAKVLNGDQRAQATFGLKIPNNPRLRVIKVASTKTARPGELVDFTIRFDNIGDQRIEHVTLVDNLTTRLEYVPDSSQSSRDGEFTTENNEGDSLVLRWQFSEPLKAGDGGVVRFQCKVR